MTKDRHSGRGRATSRRDDADRGARAPAARSGVLRIIGGRHRGRRLKFPAGVEIRPTPDRVRETLFNWLQPRIAGARVLDLFAGSGALGLEALSRGAAQVVLVEKNRLAAAAIETLGREWLETGLRVECADVLVWLAGGCDAGKFDIVFVDPPYDADLLGATLVALAGCGTLAPDARVYVESRARAPLPPLPAGWRSLRDGRAGEVGYHLLAT